MHTASHTAVCSELAVNNPNQWLVMQRAAVRNVNVLHSEYTIMYMYIPVFGVAQQTPVVEIAYSLQTKLQHREN